MYSITPKASGTDIKQIIYAYEEETGEDVVAALDFWKGAQR